MAEAAKGADIVMVLTLDDPEKLHGTMRFDIERNMVKSMTSLPYIINAL